MMMVRAQSTLFSAGLLSCLLVFACGGKEAGGEAGDAGRGGESTAGESGSGASGAGATNAGAANGGATSSGNGGSGTAGAGAVPLGVCANGEDDDGDGLIDGFDPECTGATDNDEGSFATGIPGDNRDPKWQDCFFDGNSGAGDDGCRYHTDCLYGEVDQNNANCQLTEQCVDFCRELTPNGCDCFGCCTVQGADGSNVDIMLQPACSLDKVDDEDVCPRCTKTTACENTCGRCELCPGKTEEDLPDDCTPDPPDPPPDGGTPPDPPPSYTCEGSEVCSETILCPAGKYCQLGCCMVVVR
jgi:hypothetical protein